MKEPLKGSQVKLESINKTFSNQGKDAIPIVSSKELITEFQKNGSFDKWREEIGKRIKESKEIEAIQNQVFGIIKDSSYLKNTRLNNRDLFRKLNQEVFNDEKLQNAIKKLISQKLSPSNQLYKDISGDITNSVLTIQKKQDDQHKKETLSKITKEIEEKKEQSKKDMLKQMVPQHLKNVVKKNKTDTKNLPTDKPIKKEEITNSPNPTFSQKPLAADTAAPSKEGNKMVDDDAEKKDKKKEEQKEEIKKDKKDEKNEKMVDEKKQVEKQDEKKDGVETKEESEKDKMKDDIIVKKKVTKQRELSSSEDDSSSDDEESSNEEKIRMSKSIVKEDDKFETDVLNNNQNVPKSQKKKLFTKKSKKENLDEQYAKLFPEPLPATLTFEEMMQEINDQVTVESASEEEGEIDDEDIDDDEEEDGEDGEDSFVDAFSSIRSSSLTKHGRSNVTLVDLFESDLIHEGDTLLFKHRRKEIEGKINDRGEVSAGGMDFNQPSSFAGFVDTSTDPPGHTRHNGWDNVYLKKSEKEIIQLKKLRNKFLTLRKSPKKFKRKRSNYEAHQHYEEVADATAHAARRKRKRQQ